VSHTLLTGTQVIQSEVCDQIDKTKNTGSSSECDMSAMFLIDQPLAEGTTYFEVMFLVFEKSE